MLRLFVLLSVQTEKPRGAKKTSKSHSDFCKSRNSDKRVFFSSMPTVLIFEQHKIDSFCGLEIK